MTVVVAAVDAVAVLVVVVAEGAGFVEFAAAVVVVGVVDAAATRVVVHLQNYVVVVLLDLCLLGGGWFVAEYALILDKDIDVYVKLVVVGNFFDEAGLMFFDLLLQGKLHI